MGRIKEPPPVKLIVSLFTGETSLLPQAKAALAERFGPLDHESQLMPFDHTSYYEPEFGPGLVRQIVAFAHLVPPERLAEIKLATNDLEATWTLDGKRRVNLDPGYVSLSKLVLATTKDYSHRIYLGRGIYAEVTLRYRRGAFHAWEWTYPDYASPEYLEIFGHIRQIYVSQLHSEE